MAWKLLIAGVDKTSSIAQPSSPSVKMSLNNRGSASFLVLPGYIPNKYDDVLFYAQDGVTKLWGGVVMKRSVQNFGPEQSTQTATKIDCVDYQVYGDWCFSSRAYTTNVTLKAVLQDLITDCLGTYGVTLDAGQVAGPTLPPFAWSNTKVSDAWRSLSTGTGYVLRIDANKVLKMFVPGTDSAPFITSDASPHCMALTWVDSDFQSANKVILACGASGTAPYAQSWTQAGSATSWQADIPAAAGSAPPGYVVVGGVARTVGTGASFTWDTSTSPPTLRLGTDPTPGNGTVLSLTYTGQYPFTVTVTGAGSPVRTALAADTTIVTKSAGLTAANGILTQLNQDPRLVTAKSLDIGWLPGQLWQINITPRGSININTTIGDVSITLISDTFWVYQFTATENTTYQGNAVDKWRSLLSGTTSTPITLSGSGGGGGGGGTSLSSPCYMGGSTFAWVPAPAAKTLIPGATKYVASASFTGKVRAQIRSRAGNPAIVTISDGTTDTSSTSVSSTTLADIGPFIVAITAGHTYQIYVQYTGAADDVECGWATLETAT